MTGRAGFHDAQQGPGTSMSRAGPNLSYYYYPFSHWTHAHAEELRTGVKHFYMLMQHSEPR